ncbi:MAG: hypothetical protein BWK73_06385 [Thiothrix lacustris]|uniref:Uncharacterized protein n=1 Tax=Thiothrix lacustris TaxID=525917 RepID=A0A1Y1QWU6_9GAMM|nr:MAG: hypothetical protein BWK73_06385 [Thiothrix lacustris]
MVTLCSLVTLAGCGGGGNGSNSNATGGNGGGAPTESYIDYLASNHAAYTNTGTAENPSARFEDASHSLSWLIATQTAEQAENLQKHIVFMGTTMANGGNPREWDKLFLADAYMKIEHRYETRVSVSGYNVLIEKVATDACAYQLLKAHATGVSGKFFEGNIKVDFSPLAETVIASEACAIDRSAIETYIAARLKPVPKGIQKNT